MIQIRLGFIIVVSHLSELNLPYNTNNFTSRLLYQEILQTLSIHHHTNQESSIRQSIRDDYAKKTLISINEIYKNLISVSIDSSEEVEKGQVLASSVGFTTKLICKPEDFRSLESQWNELYTKCVRSSIFSSWDWMFTWWEVYKDQFQRQLYILCIYQYNELIGIAPFQIEKVYPQSLIQGKTLRFIGSGDAIDDRILTQYQDFIALPSFESEIVEYVSNYLIQHKKDWDFADFEYLLENSLVLQCFTNHKSNKVARQKIDYGVRFTISGMDDFDSYINKMGGRWKKMFAKKNRLLSRDGEVTIEETDTLESIKPAFDQLTEMHCSRWKDRVDHCVFDSSRFCEFHKKVIRRLLPQKKSAIKTLKLNGKALATYYIFMDKGQVHYYQSGFYSKYANKYSPLFILVCKEIGRAIKNKQVFDFMYTDSTNSYKRNQYAADAEKMYRLRWASRPLRLFVFRCAKAVQIKLLDLYCHFKKIIKINFKNVFIKNK